MKTINLFTLTRARDVSDFSRLLQSLSDRPYLKPVGGHEAASLRALTENLLGCLPADDPLQYLDGFWFSYTIAHISKEFDLLKFSENGDCILNIELKSEAIGEERIRAQLEQNRYYLSNISGSIYSFTFVMETCTLYQLNDRKYLKECSFEDLAAVLRRPAFTSYIKEDLDRWFRSSDYLISPVASPERLLQGKYFLTNQQWEFRRTVLARINAFRESSSDTAPESSGDSQVPVITVTGEAGTGKTLLLFDLALELSKKKKVLFLHGGPLRNGHRLIDSRLKNVAVLSGTDPVSDPLPGDFSCLLIDEANRLPGALLSSLLDSASEAGTPCVLAYDRHSLLGSLSPLQETETVLESRKTLSLEFSGNIRINRPVFSFLRALFHQKDRPENADYSCVDVLYAQNRKEKKLLEDFYRSKGYQVIRTNPGSSDTEDVIGEEYENVLVTLDRNYYYNESMHLCAKGKHSLLPLYEGLSRTRERLCLLITGNEKLFSQILSLRM